MKYRFLARSAAKESSPFALRLVQNLMREPLPDAGLLLCVFGLLVFGWVMVYSSSALFAETRYNDQFYFLKRQLIWSAIGVGAFLISANIPLRIWQANAKVLYVVTVLALIMVLIIGPEIAGARRWIRFGGLSLQPSEFAKITAIVVVADYLDRRQSRIKDFRRGLFPLLLIMGLLLGLVVIEPDLGTPVLISLVVLSLLILGGMKWRHFFMLGIGVMPLIALAIFKESYRLKRLFAYVDPWADPRGTGYQLIQSLLAMGSGGIFGSGLGASKIKISSLPDCHTDFIFAVLAEELGLIGTLTCAGLFLFLCMRGLKIAKQSPTLFGRLIAAGISLLIGYQALINMGVACGLFPTKGMPLPFISFGGSSLMVMMVFVGMLSSLSRQGRVLGGKAAQ